MTKRDYYRLALTMPLDWLIRSTAQPSPHMRPIDIALCKLAIRKLTSH